MIGAIGNLGVTIRTPLYFYGTGALQRTRRDDALRQAQPRTQLTAVRAAQTGKPVTPVTPAPPVRDVTFDRDALLNYMQYNTAEGAVRSRIQYLGNDAAHAGENALPNAAQPAGELPQPLPGASEQKDEITLPGQEKAAENIPGLPGGEEKEPIPAEKTQSAQEVAEAGECQTCKRRKYQDGSDDPGVSFKTPTHIAPEQAAAAVRGHENEHVVRNQAKADREGRKVVSQSVSYHTAICPECGRVYVSGGTTRTITAKLNDDANNRLQEGRKSFSAVA